MSRKVLVVDDEKLIVKGVRFSLEQDGMEVDCAYDGEEAVEKAKEKKYDIILLDLMLPKMDGLEVCQQIREFSNVPIVMLTAKEFDVLELLVFNPNKVYSRENLLNIVWGYEYPGDVRTVDVHIRRLREKIETNPSEPKYVHTKWGVGYYFQAQ